MLHHHKPHTHLTTKKTTRKRACSSRRFRLPLVLKASHPKHICLLPRRLLPWLAKVHRRQRQLLPLRLGVQLALLRRLLD
jgi:hypothetical protein